MKFTFSVFKEPITMIFVFSLCVKSSMHFLLEAETNVPTLIFKSKSPMNISHIHLTEQKSNNNSRAI